MERPNQCYEEVFSPFGQKLINSGEIFGNTQFHAQFAGHDIDNDNTGLTYMHARWMDNSTGRFISDDPVKDGLNYYVYAGNNPTTFIDPDGLAKGYYTWYTQKYKGVERSYREINGEVQIRDENNLYKGRNDNASNWWPVADWEAAIGSKIENNTGLTEDKKRDGKTGGDGEEVNVSREKKEYDVEDYLDDAFAVIAEEGDSQLIHIDLVAIAEALEKHKWSAGAQEAVDKVTELEVVKVTIDKLKDIYKFLVDFDKTLTDKTFNPWDTSGDPENKKLKDHLKDAVVSFTKAILRDVYDTSKMNLKNNLKYGHMMMLMQLGGIPGLVISGAILYNDLKNLYNTVKSIKDGAENIYAMVKNNPDAFMDEAGQKIKRAVEYAKENPGKVAGVGGWEAVKAIAIARVAKADLKTKVPGKVQGNYDDVAEIAKKTKSNQTGSYKIEYESGKTYDGKGGLKRALKSAKEKSDLYSDDVKNITWDSAPNNKQAFIDEYHKQLESGGPGFDKGTNYNKIWSPGKNKVK